MAGRADPGADLGGSSGYSNESFEGRSGERFRANSGWTRVSRSLAIGSPPFRGRAVGRGGGVLRPFGAAGPPLPPPPPPGGGTSRLRSKGDRVEIPGPGRGRRIASERGRRRERARRRRRGPRGEFSFLLDGPPPRPPSVLPFLREGVGIGGGGAPDPDGPGIGSPGDGARRPAERLGLRGVWAAPAGP